MNAKEYKQKVDLIESYTDAIKLLTTQLKSEPLYFHKATSRKRVNKVNDVTMMQVLEGRKKSLTRKTA